MLRSVHLQPNYGIVWAALKVLNVAGAVVPNAGGHVRRYPGRTLTMHMNDWAPAKRQLLLGEGTVKWPEVFDAAETVGGIQWYIVEQESYPFPPPVSVEKSLANLRRLLARRG